MADYMASMNEQPGPRIRVVPEVPVAVLHRGKETWLVSARGRVLSRIPNLTFGALARIWVPRATDVAAGAFLAPEATMASRVSLKSRYLPVPTRRRER